MIWQLPSPRTRRAVLAVDRFGNDKTDVRLSTTVFIKKERLSSFLSGLDSFAEKTLNG